MSTTVRINFNSLPINVFDNTSPYSIRVFYKNTLLTDDTTLSTDPTFAGKIVVYNNSARSYDAADDIENAQEFQKASIDVTEVVQRLRNSGPPLNENEDLDSNDFKILVVQGDQLVPLTNESKEYFKFELIETQN